MVKVSVILPVYNVSLYLEQALDSVINQTLSDIEIICIDDDSTDGSYDILSEYAHRDSRIIVLKQDKNQGPGVARNRGLEYASGEYIMFLDPDDWLETDACELCYEQIKKNKNDFVLFPHNNYYQDSGENIYSDSMIEPFKNELNAPNIVLKNSDANIIDTAFCWCFIYKKAFLDRFGIRFPDYRNFEDQVFFVKVFVHAETISIIQKSLYTYRINKMSSTFTYRNQHHDILNAKREILSLANRLDDDNNIKKSIYVHTIESILYWLKLYSKYSSETEKKFFKTVKELFSYIDKEYVKNYIRPRLNKKAYWGYLAILKYNSILIYKIDILLKKIKHVFY